ncbi:hypothetical protein QWZ13_02345 [Reinekea marina]|nr:hypothetical protein [Reinekea marina]MDN3647748.1 hypothetical protein [Reinekea marina]
MAQIPFYNLVGSSLSVASPCCWLSLAVARISYLWLPVWLTQ